MVSSSMPSANAVGQHVFEAVGVPPLPTDRFCVDTLPPKTTVRYCLDPKLIPVPKELPDA